MAGLSFLRESKVVVSNIYLRHSSTFLRKSNYMRTSPSKTNTWKKLGLNRIRFSYVFKMTITRRKGRKEDGKTCLKQHSVFHTKSHNNRKHYVKKGGRDDGRSHASCTPSFTEYLRQVPEHHLSLRAPPQRSQAVVANLSDLSGPRRSPESKAFNTLFRGIHYNAGQSEPWLNPSLTVKATACTHLCFPNGRLLTDRLQTTVTDTHLFTE